MVEIQINEDMIDKDDIHVYIEDKAVDIISRKPKDLYMLYLGNYIYTFEHDEWELFKKKVNET